MDAMQQVVDDARGCSLREISHCARALGWERMLLPLVSLGMAQGQLGLDTVPEALFSRTEASCPG